MRMLIVRIGAMGDVLHAMPAVAAMQALHPEWEVDWALEPRWSPLLEADGDRPLIRRWTPVTTKEWQRRIVSAKTAREVMALRRTLRESRYDLCVDMQGSIKSAVVGRLASAKRFVGMAAPRERPAAWFYGERVAVTSPHMIEQGCELLGAAIGERLEPARVSLPRDAEAERWADSFLEDDGRPFVLMAPTAGWGAKQWPAERFGAVAAALSRAGYRTLVNAAGGVDAAAAAVVAASEGAAVAAPTTIARLIALTRRASLVIAGDTGPLHMAAALERPVVGLYGPTDPARNGPYGTRARVLRHEMSVTDHSRRQETESGLMRIGVNEVVGAAMELLAS